MGATIPVIKQNGSVIKEAYIGSTITIELSADSTAYDHDIYYGLAGETFELATFVSGTQTWEIPLDLCNLLPNTTEGRFTIRVETYEGYSLIGSKNAVITVKVPESITPTALESNYVDTLPEVGTKFGGFVQNNSSLEVTINASGAYGSSIIQCTTEFLGRTYTGLKFTTDVLDKSGTHAIKTTVTDSRGRKLVINDSIYILPYEYPTGSISAYRCRSDGTKSDEGEYVRIEFEYVVDVMDNHNIGSYVVKYSIAGENSFTNLIAESEASTAYSEIFTSSDPVLQAEYPYTIRLTVGDYFRTVNIDIDIPVGFMVMDFNDNGRAIGFGKASEKNIGIEFNMPIYDQFDTRILNGLAFYESGGSTDANTTTEELFLSTVNTPTSDFWYVRQTFYSGKSATANRTQYAMPYNKSTSSNYRRMYVNGAWTDWIKIPVIIEEGSSGIWSYKKWSNGRAECNGRIPISSLPMTTALGTWYRSVVQDGGAYPYPFTFVNVPVTSLQYATNNGVGGLVWLTTEGTKSAPPSFYLIRPTSVDSGSGYINVLADGYFT